MIIMRKNSLHSILIADPIRDPLAAISILDGAAPQRCDKPLSSKCGP